ncbi:MAG TPA: type VI secretion system protein [Terriglobia bacterium]|jgi:type VI secretion system protein ImpL
MAQLTKFLPYILGAVGVLIAAIAASVILIIRSSRKGSASQTLSTALKQRGALDKQYEKYRAGAEGSARKAGAAIHSAEPSAGAAVPHKPGLWTRIKHRFGLHSGALPHSFKEAIKLLKDRIPGRDFRYRVPWFVMAGEAGSGKTTLLDHVGLPQPFGRVGGDPFELRKPVTWWLFTNGVVLDVDGSMVSSHDGRASDDIGWRTFLSLLRRNRPERPIDGFIAAIPVDDLIGPNKLSNEDLRRKADLIYEKMWSVQKMLGMTFPVYVFITKCDHISGFRSYVSELPKNLRDDMFGWSNPYSVHAAYVPDWVDEAFKNLNNTIYKTQIEIFAESDTVEDSDGVFLFPAEFQTLIEPVRGYLNHLFKESAHHESFLFRGLYFCGDAQLDAPVNTALGGEYTPSAGAAAEPQPVFVKHVFEKKIFPEHPLAHPVFRSVLARNRWALAGQVACILFLLFGSLALFLSKNRLQQETAAFEPVMAQVEKDLTQVRDVEKSNNGKLTAAEILQRLEGVDPTKILMGMEEINAATLRSFWLPGSWFTSLDERLDQSMNLTFSKIVLGSIYLNLTEHLQEAQEMAPPAPPADTAYHPAGVASLPEFQTFRRYVDRVKELEPYITMYNFEAMPESGDLPTLGKLVKFIYGTELPPAFYENADFYLRALKASQQDVINVDKVKQAVADKQQVLGQKFFDAVADRELPVMQLDELQAELDTLAKEPTTADSDPAPYRALMGTIDQLNQTFSKPELAWLGKPGFAPGSEYAALLDAIQMSTLFGPAARMKLEDMAAENVDSMRSTLENYQSSLTGPILQTADNMMKPSAALLALRKGLEDFLNQRFMAQASGRRIRTAAPQGSRFAWDLPGLQQAQQLVEPYNAFIAGGLTTFNPELQNRLRVMALNRLEANMVSLISNAQKVEPAVPASNNLEQDVQNETKQLKDTAKPLTDLLAAFDRLGMSRAYNDLAEATLAGAFQHLRTVEQLFEQKAPYVFNEAGLARWEGAEPLVTVVFGVKDDKELPQYLDAQRENLKRLKENADPALSIITSQRAGRRSAADAQLLAKWQNIATELEKYDNKNPANNVTALETFVSTVLPSLTTQNYSDKISPQDLAAQSTDFFLNKRNELRRLVYERFDSIATATVVQQFRELESTFNQKLAGKFPFVPGPGRGGEADPQSIRDFFKLFDAYNKNIIKYLERPQGRTGSGPRVLQFIDDMVSVRALFAPFLDDAKALAPVFDFEVEFRVNRRRESGGNQIIEWQLEVGDQTITARDTMRRGRWVLGDKTRLVLRWAKDANIIPAPENAEGVVYEDRKVTFEDTTRWSMLRFFRTHASVPADFDQLIDPAPQTLKFIVPTMMTGDDPMMTKVFVRLTLLTADKKEPITLPAFPERAPSLDRS